MEIDESWIPTLFCVVNDSIKYNDALRNSQTVKDIEDIEEWMMSIYQFKGYLSEQIVRDEALHKKYEKYLED